MAKSVYTIKVGKGVDKQDIMQQCKHWLDKADCNTIHAFQKDEMDKNGMHKYWYVVWQCNKCGNANHLYVGHLTAKLKKHNGHLQLCNCKGCK